MNWSWYNAHWRWQNIVFSNSKYCDDLKALVLGKMKDEMVDVCIEEFIGIKLKIYSIFVSNSSKYKKVKGVNKNVVAIINHNEYKDAFLE